MKRFQSACAALVALILLLLSSALADVTPTLRIYGAWASEGALQATVYATATGNLQPDGFEVTLNGSELALDSVQTYDHTQSGVTYLLLADLPRGMQALSTVQELFLGITARMSDADNAAVILTNDTIDDIALTSDVYQLQQRISGLEKDSSRQKLNATIGRAVSLCAASKLVKGRCVLVVASTGEKRDESGMTQSELLRAVGNAPITIYTYAFLPKDPSNQLLTQANEFGSVARASIGGMSTTVTSSERKSEPLLVAFAESEQRFLLLTASGAAAQGADNRLQISLQDGSYLLSDQTVISAAAASAPTSTPVPEEPRPTPTPAPTTELVPMPTVAPDPEPAPSLEVWLLIGLGVLLLSLVAVLLIVKYKRKPADDGPSSEQTAPAPSTEAADGKTQFVEDDVRTEPDNNPVGAKPRVHVTLTQLGGDERQVYSADMNETLLIGRTAQQARLVIPTDKMISSTHAKLTYRSGVMRIEDADSRNGTSVNAVRIVSPTVLHPQDVLTLGHTSLRVDWRLL